MEMRILQITGKELTFREGPSRYHQSGSWNFLVELLGKTLFLFLYLSLCVHGHIDGRGGQPYGPIDYRGRCIRCIEKYERSPFGHQDGL